MSFQSQPRFFASAAIAAPCFWPTSKAAMPRYGTSSMKLPLASTKRSSTAITFKPLALALATIAGPRDTSGGQITKPLAPLAARLSMAERVFSPSGTAILITVKPCSLPAFSAKAHSVWNQGSSACLTRKPIFTSSAETQPLKLLAATSAAAQVRERMLRGINISNPLVVIGSLRTERLPGPTAGWVLLVVKHRTAAIDHQAGGVDEWRLVGRQEQRRHRHLDRLADTSWRVQVEGPLPLGVGVVEAVPVVDIELGFDIARCNGVDPNALGRVLDTQRPRQPEQAMLGHRVGKAARNDVTGMGRGDIDDVADALLDHVRQYRAATEPGAVQVDGEATAPILVAHLQRVAKHIHAGTVDQHVDAPELLDGQVHQGTPLLLGGNVHGLGMDLGATFTPAGSHTFDFLALDIADHQPRLLCLEAGDYRLADPLGRPGHHHHFAFQPVAVGGFRNLG